MLLYQKRIVLGAWFALTTMVALTQRDELKFTHYTIRDGLLSSQANSIVQDKDGFLWVATNVGLNRFNGYEFEDMTFLLGVPPPVTVHALLSSQSGQLWIGTQDYGIFVYNPRAFSVVRYQTENQACLLQDNYVKTLLEDSRGRIWVGTWFGLSLFRPDAQTFTAFPFDTPESHRIFNYNLIETIAEAPDGQLWIGTWGGGLHAFDPQRESFRHFEHFTPEHGDRNLWVRDLSFGRAGQLWIATVGDGLFELDVQTLAVQQHRFFPESRSEGFRRLLALHQRDDDELWIGTEDGLIRFNTNTEAYTLTKDDQQGSAALLDKYVNRIFEDNHKGIWINAGGLNYFNYGAAKFQLVRQNGQPGGLSDNEVFSFFEHRPGEIWVSTKQGINIYDRTSQRFTFRSPFPGPVSKLLPGPLGEVVAIGPRIGLHRYWPASGQLRSYGEAADPSQGLRHNHPNDLEIDTHGNIWISTFNGLSCLRAADGRFFHFSNALRFSGGLPGLSVSKIIKDDRGAIWVINDKSLLRLELPGGRLLEAGGATGLIADTSLYHFKKYYSAPVLRGGHYAYGRFWLIQDGLASFDPLSGETQVFTRTNGLASNEIRTVTDDGRKGLWITTDNGLSYLNVQTLEITNFYEEDGLQGNNFSKWAALKTSTGEIWLGGNNGFNIVQPDEIGLNPHVPPVIISGLRVLNEPVPVLQPGTPQPEDGRFYLPSDIPHLEEIKLSYRQNTITIEFAALNFLYPEQNQYAYKLEGVDKEWNYVKNRRYASYSNLPQGQWLTFKVKASNNNGIWNTQEARLRLYIKPPVWNTAWFRWLAALFVTSLVIAFYLLRVQQLKAQKKHLERVVIERTQAVQQQKQEIEAQNAALQRQSEQLQEIDRAKTRFYSNISHEFRTPLSLIVGPAEELIKDSSLSVKAREYLRIINQNGKRLLRLVTQIMDISKLEDGVLRLEVAQGDIVQAVNSIAESFQFMAENKHISFCIESNQPAARGYFDRDKIEKIVYNLLNNAFKYTDSGHSIWLEIEVQQSTRGDEAVIIRIKDTGIGIPEGEQEHVFKQYYRVENQYAQRQFGAGIGLSLVKKLVSLHKGKITLESAEGHGTTFTVTIPLLKESYQPGDIFEDFVQNPDAALHQADPDEELALSAPLLPAAEKRRKILLVEDNQSLLLFMKNVLWEHFDILEAADGAAGWEAARQERPDLIVSDVMMPKMNGFELCAKVKQSEQTRHIPLILLTAKNAAADQEQGLQAQADEYLSKPVDMGLLRLKIRNLITARETIKELYESPLSSHISPRSQEEASQDFLRKVLKVLEDNISNENLNIELFVQELGVSRTLLYEKVKAATGDSLNKLIKTYRLNYAAKLLLEEHYIASELAYMVGFTDPKYFSKCFNKQFGMTPKAYLKAKTTGQRG
jgi:signal transduction histidine kinase/ligand-binding sensor domain-containing protein/CheY-like chemotaxis protein/AraC-like DNA-binding protein